MITLLAMVILRSLILIPFFSFSLILLPSLSFFLFLLPSNPTFPSPRPLDPTFLSLGLPLCMSSRSSPTSSSLQLPPAQISLAWPRLGSRVGPMLLVHIQPKTSSALFIKRLYDDCLMCLKSLKKDRDDASLFL